MKSSRLKSTTSHAQDRRTELKNKWDKSKIISKQKDCSL